MTLSPCLQQKDHYNYIDDPVAQGPIYTSRSQLINVIKTLKYKKNLVSIDHIRALFKKLQKDEFIVHAGDCAEIFASPPRHTQVMCEFFEKIFKIFNEKCTIIGRIAGQYAKPRSQQTEVIHGQTISSFLGDIINGQAIDQRTPDPFRMLKGYEHSQKVLKEIPFYLKELNLGEAFFTGHEAYLLPFEQAMTRQEHGEMFATSSHFLWVGERTRQPHLGHIKFAASIDNPIGVKIGPNADPEQIKFLVHLLNPHHIKGRLSLIIRLGRSVIKDQLPQLLKHLKNEDVLWICDPMHGNTEKLSNGMKTRCFSNVMDETHAFFDILSAFDLKPNGIHCEASGYEHITECLDEIRGIIPGHMDCFQSACDPRLNASQMIELVTFCKSLLRV